MFVDTVSEAILIFNALNPKLTDTFQINTALEYFFREKNKRNSSDRFNIIAYQNNGPHYLKDFTLNYRHVIKALKTMEPNLAQPDLVGGIFLAVSLFIDIFKKITGKLYYLLILMDSFVNKIPKELMPALENIIIFAKYMPLSMDFIKIRDTDYLHDIQLQRLAGLCEGKVYSIKDDKQIHQTIELILEQRTTPSFSLYRNNKIFIAESVVPYYEHLSEEPIRIEEESTCSICFQTERHLISCPRCDTRAHDVCWAKWGKLANIGTPHLFRCHNCFNLLKLDLNFVDIIQSEARLDKEEDYFDVINVEEQLERLKFEKDPRIIEVQRPPTITINEDDDKDIIILDDDNKRE